MIAQNITSETALSDVFEDVYRPTRLNGRAASTIHQFRVNIKNFERYLGRTPVVSDLSNDTLSRFIGSFVERGRAPRTGNKARDNFCAIWRLLCRRGIRQDWPEVQELVEEHDEPLAWTEEELARLFKAAAETPSYVGEIRAGAWWLALHFIIWDSAERIGAVMQTKWDQIDLNGGFFTALARTRKGKRKGKLFKLHKHTRAALQLIREPDRELVFPWPYPYTYLFTRYTVILKRAGLPSGRDSKFHRIRKSVASHATVAGLNPTHLLGHSSPRVTERYLDPRIVERPQAADVLFRPVAIGGDDEPEQARVVKPFAPPKIVLPGQRDAGALPVEKFEDVVKTYRLHLRYTGRDATAARACVVRAMGKRLRFEMLDEIDVGRIRRFIAGGLESREMSSHTASQYRTQWRNFFRWLRDDCGIDGPPTDWLCQMDEQGGRPPRGCYKRKASALAELA